MLIPGRCHCGNISLTLRWTPEPAEIPVRVCSCSFCTRHGAAWTTCATAALRVRVSQAALVSRYSFATGTAEFHVCARCGVVPLVTSRIAGQLYAAVNVQALDGLEPSRLRSAAVNFDGETVEQRLARRRRYWITDIEYVEAGA